MFYALIFCWLVSLLMLPGLWSSRESLAFKLVFTLILIFPLLGPVLYLFARDQTPPQHPDMQSRGARGTYTHRQISKQAWHKESAQNPASPPAAVPGGPGFFAVWTKSQTLYYFPTYAAIYSLCVVTDVEAERWRFWDLSGQPLEPCFASEYGFRLVPTDAPQHLPLLELVDTIKQYAIPAPLDSASGIREFVALHNSEKEKLSG